MTSNSTDSNSLDIHDLQPILKDRAVITMPYYIDYDAFREMEWALDWNKYENIRSDRPIVKFLGTGGNYNASLAIGEMLRDYNAIGILSGGCYSGHTIAFMMCPERYAYQSAYFGIHSPAITPDSRSYSSADFRIEIETHNYFDTEMSEIFAQQSVPNKYDVEYWKALHESARLSTKLISGVDLIYKYGLAQDMKKFPESEQWRIGRKIK